MRKKPKTQRKDERVSIRLDYRTAKYLRRRALVERRTITAVIEKILADGLMKAGAEITEEPEQHAEIFG